MISIKIFSLLFLVGFTLAIQQDLTVDFEGEPPVDFEHENILGKLANQNNTNEVIIKMKLDLYR